MFFVGVVCCPLPVVFKQVAGLSAILGGSVPCLP